MKETSLVMTFRCVVGAAVLTLASLRSEAALLVNQPSDYPGSFTAITSQSLASGASYESFDNFTVGSTPADVLSLTWQGLYWDPRSLSLNPPDSPPNSVPPGVFEIGFYTNVNNLPGTLIGSAAIGLTITDSAVVGQAKFGPDNAGSFDTVNITNYSANLVTPFDLTPYEGQQLWLTIVWFPTVTPSYPPVWLWTSGEGGDGKSAQLNYSQGSIYYTTGDRAFSLSSNADSSLPLTSPGDPNNLPLGQLADAPEPGSLALAVAGLVLCGTAAFWRRRTKGAIVASLGK